jgi:hypothetical protein
MRTLDRTAGPDEFPAHSPEKDIDRLQSYYRQIGLSLRHRRTTTEKQAAVLAMAGRGMTRHAIADATGVAKSYVVAILKAQDAK